MARQGNAWLKRIKLSIDELNHDWQRMVVNFNNDTQYRMLEKLGLPRLKLWQIMVIVLAITAVWCVAILGMPMHLKNTRRIDEKLWSRYVSTLERLGVKRLPSETPNQFIDRAMALMPTKPLIRAVGKNLIQLRFEQTDSADNERLCSEIKKGLNKLYIHSLMHRQTEQQNRPTA